MSPTVLKQTEKQFQAAVVEYAELNGWLIYHTYDSRRSNPGFPDLVMVHRGEGEAVPRRCRLVFAELKTERGRTSLAQAVWLEALGRIAAVGGACINWTPKLQVYLWRPSSWPEIEKVLAR
jgi:hypothetical protein